MVSITVRKVPVLYSQFGKNFHFLSFRGQKHTMVEGTKVKKKYPLLVKFEKKKSLFDNLGSILAKSGWTCWSIHPL